MDRVLRVKELVNIVGLHRTTLWRRSRNGTFPPSFKIAGSRAVGWYESDIEKWLEQQGQAGASRAI